MDEQVQNEIVVTHAITGCNIDFQFLLEKKIKIFKLFKLNDSINTQEIQQLSK